MSIACLWCRHVEIRSVLAQVIVSAARLPFASSSKLLRGSCGRLQHYCAWQEAAPGFLLAFMKKTKALSLKDANSNFQMMDARVWSDELSQLQFRIVWSQKSQTTNRQTWPEVARL